PTPFSLSFPTRRSSDLFLRLNELFFQALQIGYVAAGENHTLDIPLFIGQGTEIKTNPPPISRLVAQANFQRGKVLLPGHDVLVKRFGSSQILGLSAAAKCHALRGLDFVP